MRKVVQLIAYSQYGEYKSGDYAFLEGFVRGGDDVPCAVISLKDGKFTLAPIYHLKRTDKVTL